MKELPRLVAFDMDGTLIDNYEFHLRTWEVVCAELGAPRTRDEIIKDLHGTNHEVCQTFFGGHLTADETHKIGLLKEEKYREIYRPHIQEVKGLKQFLTRLKDLQIPIALGTMGNADNAKFTLDALELHPFFKDVFTAESVERGKPHPDIFLNCWNASFPQEKPKEGEFWVFEDTSSGIQSAVNAGAIALGIRTSKSNSELKKHGAFQTFSNFEEVLNSLVKLTA